MANLDGFIFDAAGSPDLSSIYAFGLPPKVSEAPINLNLENSIEEREISNQSYPTIVSGTQGLDNPSFRFQPVNLIPWYLFFGKYSVAAAVHTITHFDRTARKPAISVFTQRSTTKRQGEVIRIQSFDYEFSQGYGEVNMIGKGLDYSAASDSPASASFPGSESSPFNALCATGNSWDGNEINLLNVKFQGQQALDTYKDSTKKNIEMNEFHVQHGVFTVQFLETQQNTIFETDYLAGTKKTFIHKIVKTDSGKSDQYMQMSASCLIKAAIPTPGYLEGVVWTAVLIPEAITITGKDGITDISAL